MTKIRRIAWVAGVLLLAAGVAAAQTGVKKKRLLPHEYGRVVMNVFEKPPGLAPVVFEHWLHRTEYTCRLCHVDLAFAMKAGGTKVTAADNQRGFYCGACHNGKLKYRETTVFSSCESSVPSDPKAAERCNRCHSEGKLVKPKHDFYTFTAKFPKERFGNGIDWVRAEQEGLIRLEDVIEGVQSKRKTLPVQGDFALPPRVQGMPEIIFSHEKHNVWNSCEVCHPEIFFGVNKGSTKYSMVEIFEGKYCGVCHITVAFPLLDCQRCHSKPVQ